MDSLLAQVVPLVHHPVHHRVHLRTALQHRRSPRGARSGGHADARRLVRQPAGALRGLQLRGAALQVVAAECTPAGLRRLRQRSSAAADPHQGRTDGRGDGNAHLILDQRHSLSGLPA